MSKNEVYLGIDTSCYTTSVALIGREGGLVGEARRILQVKPGCRGLQQSVQPFHQVFFFVQLIAEEEPGSNTYEQKNRLQKA